jgi:RNA polymerase sigma-70 factor, ECF subfamily
VSGREIEWAEGMRAALAGDAAAYRRLLDGLACALRPLSRRKLVQAGFPAADAEDVVQETLLAIHLKRHTWDAEAPIGPWIMTIARNKMIDAMRRGGRRVHLPLEDFVEVLAAADTPADRVERDVERHVNALPQRQREVVRAIAVEGASITEAAGKLEMSEGAVRVALHRGLTALAAKHGD